jgi:hypothetical protein
MIPPDTHRQVASHDGLSQCCCKTNGGVEHLNQELQGEFCRHVNEHELLFDSAYEEQAHLAERELSSFTSAVKELYGSELAKLSAEDWLDESELMDGPPQSEIRNWRAVTIAASARLANRVNVGGARGDAALRT